MFVQNFFTSKIWLAALEVGQFHSVRPSWSPVLILGIITDLEGVLGFVPGLAQPRGHWRASRWDDVQDSHPLLSSLLPLASLPFSRKEFFKICALVCFWKNEKYYHLQFNKPISGYPRKILKNILAKTDGPPRSPQHYSQWLRLILQANAKNANILEKRDSENWAPCLRFHTSPAKGCKSQALFFFETYYLLCSLSGCVFLPRYRDPAHSSAKIHHTEALTLWLASHFSMELSCF